MLCWHKNLDSYPNVVCLQFCFEQKFTICMGLCMGKQLILVCGLGMENPPKFDFFLYFLLIHPKSDSAMTGASRYDNYSPQWGPLLYTTIRLRHLHKGGGPKCIRALLVRQKVCRGFLWKKRKQNIVLIIPFILIVPHPHITKLR